jgi:phosphohistidine phosphatase
MTLKKSMKKLILVRHAKADSKNPYPSDFDRPLNERGKNDAPLMGKLLKQNYPSVHHFLSSPALRAKTTAEIFALEYGFEPANIDFDRSLYLASPKEILGALSLLDNSINSVALFGHNPGITDLANHLGKKFIMNMPTASFAVINIETDKWSKIEHSHSLLEHFDFPKSHK